MSQVVLLKRGTGEFNAASGGESIALNRGTHRRFLLVVFVEGANNLASAPTLGGVSMELAWDGSTSRAEAGVFPQDLIYMYDLVESRFPADGAQDLVIDPTPGTARVLYAWFLLDQCDQNQILKAAYASFETDSVSSPIQVSHAAASEDDFTLAVYGGRESMTSASAPFEASIVTQSGFVAELGVAHYIGLLEAGTCDWTISTGPTTNRLLVSVTLAGRDTDVLKRNTRHVPEARARVVGALLGKPRFNALLRSYVRRIQELEDALWALMDAYDPRIATGLHLTKLGYLVGQPRLGFDDDTYRRVLFGRIRAAQSLGRALDLLEVLQLVCDLRGDDVWTAESVGNATVLARVGRALTEAESAALLYLLPKTRAAGVQLHLSSPGGSSEPGGSTGYLFSGGAESGDLPHDVRRL